MSKTDKDKPHWVQAEWFEAYHFCQDYNARAWQKFARPCDLPPYPIRKRDHRYLGKNRTSRCEWFPKTDINHHSVPPKWFVNHVWLAPERVRQRDNIGEMKKEYRASRNIDYEFQNFHHRNNARWMWN